MKHNSECIKKTISQKRLYNLVKEVSSYHRIQASTGFREAANYCKNMFDKLGIESQILSYTADPSVWYLQNKMFYEWDLKRGWLQLLDPEVMLADTTVEPISIIQKSYPCDLTDGVDLVYLNKGNNSKEYEEVDLTGKLVFVRGPFAQYMWQNSCDFVGRSNYRHPYTGDHGHSGSQAPNCAGAGWKCS